MTVKKIKEIDDSVLVMALDRGFLYGETLKLDKDYFNDNFSKDRTANTNVLRSKDNIYHAENKVYDVLSWWKRNINDIKILMNSKETIETILYLNNHLLDYKELHPSFEYSDFIKDYNRISMVFT